MLALDLAWYMYMYKQVLVGQITSRRPLVVASVRGACFGTTHARRLLDLTLDNRARRVGFRFGLFRAAGSRGSGGRLSNGFLEIDHLSVAFGLAVSSESRDKIALQASDRALVGGEEGDFMSSCAGGKQGFS